MVDSWLHSLTYAWIEASGPPRLDNKGHKLLGLLASACPGIAAVVSTSISVGIIYSPVAIPVYTASGYIIEASGGVGSF